MRTLKGAEEMSTQVPLQAANSTTHVAFLDEYDTYGFWSIWLSIWSTLYLGTKTECNSDYSGGTKNVLTSSLRIVTCPTITKNNGRLPRAPRFAFLSSFLCLNLPLSHQLCFQNFALLDSEHHSILQHNGQGEAGLLSFKLEACCFISSF